jgi:hypothetical protein
MPNKVRLTEKQIERLHGWAQELRTTKKHQGQSVLRGATEPHETFCCLGIYGMMRKPESWEYDEVHNDWNLLVGEEVQSLELPEFLKKELGLNKSVSVVGEGHVTTSIRDIEAVFINLNDDAGWSFKKIASEVDHYAKNGTISEKAQIDCGLKVTEYEPE